MFDDEIPIIEITYKIRGGINFEGEGWDWPEYHIVLQPYAKHLDSAITYYLTKFIGKTRKLSAFEAQMLIDAVSAITPKFPTYVEEIIICDPPTPILQLIVKSGQTIIDMTWEVDDCYEDNETPDPTNQLIRLIEKIEPLDYKGLNVEPIVLR